jgi:hypothetical protein
MKTQTKKNNVIKELVKLSKNKPQSVKKGKATIVESPQLASIKAEIEHINKTKSEFVPNQPNPPSVDTSKDFIVATIFSTMDYGRFDLYFYNRIIKWNKVVEIAEAMKTANLSKFFPIVVDKQFHLCDGQHRFYACKILGLPICYIIKDDWDISDLPLLQGPRQSWHQEEYVHYYSAQGVASYIALHNFKEKHGINYEAALKLCTKSCSPKAFKKGDFKYDNERNAEEVMKVADEIQALQDEKHKVGFMPKHSRGLLGLKIFLRIPGVDPKQLVRKMTQNWKMVRNSQSSLDCVILYGEIYNTGKGGKKVILQPSLLKG